MSENDSTVGGASENPAPDATPAPQPAPSPETSNVETGDAAQGEPLPESAASTEPAPTAEASAPRQSVPTTGASSGAAPAQIAVAMKGAVQGAATVPSGSTVEAALRAMDITTGKELTIRIGSKKVALNDVLTETTTLSSEKVEMTSTRRASGG